MIEVTLATQGYVLPKIGNWQLPLLVAGYTAPEM